MSGRLKEILIAEAANSVLVRMNTVALEAGRGIVGDRYHASRGTFSAKLAGLPDAEVTLVELEEIDAFNARTGRDLDGRDFRRNLVTEGVRLNDLVGREFTVGVARLRGIRLCEPCAHLAGILGGDVLEHTVHRAGLRAQILSGGRIAVSDPIEPAT